MTRCVERTSHSDVTRQLLDDEVCGGRALARAERGAEQGQGAGEQAAGRRLLCERLLGGRQRFGRADAGAARATLGTL